jgi:hypothetical protein
MAIKYCDHGAYGAYAATPAWGVPQDGDGDGKAASTASATAAIVFTGVPAGTISVCGVTVSPTWGATADSAANGLATVINGSSAVVATPGFTSGPQLRSAVFARGPAGGAPAGTCQIMSRHGSALLNGQIAIAHSLTNVDSGGSSLVFSGGVSGCWGYILNDSVVWPQGTLRAGYGVLAGVPSFTGTLGAGDLVKVRSGKLVSLVAASYNIVPSNRGSAEAPVEIRFDDGSEWPQDGSAPVTTVEMQYSSNNYILTYGGNTLAFMALRAPRYSDGTRGLRFVGKSSYQNNGGVVLNAYGNARYENIDFLAEGGGANTPSAGISPMIAPADDSGVLVLYGVRFSAPRFVGLLSGGALKACTIYGYGIEFKVTQETVMSGPVLRTSQYSATSLFLDGTKFVGFVTGSQLATVPSGSIASRIQLSNSEFGGITNRDAGYFSATSGYYDMFTRFLMLDARSGANDFASDTYLGVADWNSALPFPTLNAKLADGITPWSIRLRPSPQAGRYSGTRALRSPELAKYNTLGVSRMRLTVQLCATKGFTMSGGTFAVAGTYRSSSGAAVGFDTSDGTVTTLTPSTEAWTQIQTDPADGQQRVTFSQGGTLYLDRYKVVYETITPVAADAVITLVAQVSAQAATISDMVFIDPEFTMEAI